MKSLFSNKPLLTFMVIVGTVVGSGFLSGKEIVVFFSRFGKISYFCILLAFFMFWGLFYFFLKFGQNAISRLASSRFATVLNTLICLILCAAMFAGARSVCQGLPLWLQIAVSAAILFFAIRVALVGSATLEKLSLMLVPVMIVFLLVVLSIVFQPKGASLFQGKFLPLGCLYCVMYVVLNTCNSAIVISSYAPALSNKQKVQVSFAAALALCLILLLGDVVLLQNSYAFGQNMPLLYIVKGVKGVIMGFIVLLGCCTTLFSLVYTVASNLRTSKASTKVVLSVVLPFCCSFLGFGVIVSNLYPLTSILGIFVLCDLFLIPLFKKADKRIHSTRKQT